MKKILISSLSAVAFLVLFVMVFQPIDPTMNGLCINSSKAQDNPCLPQEATISALQLALSQSTITVLHYQSTITFLESQQSQSSPNLATSIVEVGSNDIAFTETFDDNTRGWELVTNEDYAIRLSQGQLRMSTDGYWIFTAIPNLNADEYYIETIADPFTPCCSSSDLYFGFAVGDFEQGSYQFLLVGSRSPRSSDTARVVRVDEVVNDDLDDLFATEYPSLQSIFEEDTQTTIGLELRNNLFTFYVNGIATESIPAVYGNMAGIAISSDDGDYSVTFDNLVVRPTR